VKFDNDRFTALSLSVVVISLTAGISLITAFFYVLSKVTYKSYTCSGAKPSVQNIAVAANIHTINIKPVVTTELE